MAVFLLADRLPREWVAFIDNTAGEAALKKGYGKDTFCQSFGTAARRGWRPVFARVESKECKANVADAVSRADLTRPAVSRAGGERTTTSTGSWRSHHAVDALYQLAEPEPA